MSVSSVARSVCQYYVHPRPPHYDVTSIICPKLPSVILVSVLPSSETSHEVFIIAVSKLVQFGFLAFVSHLDVLRRAIWSQRVSLLCSLPQREPSTP